MKKMMVCLMMLLFLVVPIFEKTAIFRYNPGAEVNSLGTCQSGSNIALSENGDHEDDDATDNGEDRMDGECTEVFLGDEIFFHVNPC